MPKTLPSYVNFELCSLEPFSRVRLVALDLDGTVLKPNKSLLPRKLLELAKKLRYSKNKEHRIRLTIATGRTLTGARELLNELPIYNDTPIILYNGSVVLNNKYEVKYKKVVPFESFDHIVKICSNFEVQLLAYSINWLEADGPLECAFGWSTVDRPEFDYNNMLINWQNYEDVTCDIEPSAVVIHTKGVPQITSAICAELAKIPGISYMCGGTYLEVIPENSNKGKALEYVASSLGLSREQVLAIGDNDNDAEMLSWAGIGVAVDSASDLAKKSSDFLAKRGVLEGAVEALRNVLHARHHFDI